MTKAEFIDEIKKQRGIDLTRKDVELVVNAVFDVLTTALRRHKKFTMPGFGIFQVRVRKARAGTDPRNGEPIKIAATKTVSFRPSPRLRTRL